MDDREAKEMMQRSIAEIEMLRREVGQLRPQAEAYQAITQILSLLPQKSQGYGEDLVWKLRKRIEELDKAKSTNAT
ncbi:MAG: hypothetical protein KGI71_04320 [Patescibacteria group bacterium]|nr:hypothetical protein [Patescibacteria group bacterium]